MEIYLIRHTAVRETLGMCYGKTDVELDPSYETQFKKILSKIPAPEELTCFSSPLKRCLKLAESIAAGRKVNISDQLLELNFGSWEMKMWNSIPKSELNRWMESFIDLKCPQGESYQDLCERILQFWKELISARQYKRVGVITHAGPIRAILSDVLSISLRDSFSFRIDVGSVSKLNIDSKGHAKIHYTNA